MGTPKQRAESARVKLDTLAWVLAGPGLWLARLAFRARARRTGLR